ncbi:MAG: NAD(P)H-binding protein [Myxococcota bacterium]|nr:NAD(P)H-binding protein [Myxococcota bacterium]
MPDEGRVLVTGANGHLGRRLLGRLSGERPLRAVVRSERAAAQVAEAAQVETAILDYADADALTRAAEGCSHAVHLVGILKEGSTSSYEQAHEATTQALTVAAARQGLSRIVYLSILGSRPESRNACLASKGRAEQILLEAKTPALVLRVPMVLGEGDVASRALRGQALAPFLFQPRGGASLEQPIYAGDVIEALVAGVTRDDLDDVALDLAGPESLSHRHLVARAAELHGRSPRVFPLPLSLLRGVAGVLEAVSKDPPVTRAMLGVLDHDDDVDPAPACARLGIELTPIQEALRRCVGPEAP